MTKTRVATALFALARVAFGAGLVAAPDRVAAGWIGADAGREPVKIVIRAVGARDIALSAGLLTSLSENEGAAPWLIFTIASDLCDLTATLLAPAESLPPRARWGTAVMAGGAALAGAGLLGAMKR